MRTAARVMVDGEAGEADAWLIYSNEMLKPYLVDVMPGLRWVPWKGEHLTRAEDGSEVVRQAIERVLAELPETTERVSLRWLWGQPTFKDYGEDTRRRGLESYLENPWGWQKNGRSLIRNKDLEK